MATRILVPMDDSEMAERALRHALDLHPGAEITVMHVVGEPSSMLGAAASLALEDDVQQASERQASEVFDRARAVAREYDATVETDVRVGHPVRAILEDAGEFDLLVIGSHSGGLADRLFVGNVAEKLVRQSPTPVTVVR